MVRTYLEKFYFPLHARFFDGKCLFGELTDEEMIECIPFMQNKLDEMQEDGILPQEMANDLNGSIGFSKVISATWGVTHRYGVPYGIVRVRCSEPIDVYERHEMRLIIGYINEDGIWYNLKHTIIDCGDKAIAVSFYENVWGDYFVHTQSLMYLKWKRKKKTKKWRDS